MPVVLSSLHGVFWKFVEAWITRNAPYIKGLTLDICALDDHPIPPGRPIRRVSPIVSVNEYGGGDCTRLQEILKYLHTSETCIQCDLDIFLHRNISELLPLPYDFMISKEMPFGIYEETPVWPQECSTTLGFGGCTGFYIAKPSAAPFLQAALEDMKKKTFGSHSDQLTFMKMWERDAPSMKWTLEEVSIAGNIFHVHTATYPQYGNIRLCVLDRQMLVRDTLDHPGFYGNHIGWALQGEEKFLQLFQ